MGRATAARRNGVIKIQNDAWSFLRDFFQPGRGREAGAPRTVSEVLFPTIDSEEWIQLPRFIGLAQSPGVAAVFSVIQITAGQFGVTGLLVKATIGLTALCHVVAGENLEVVTNLAAARVADSFSAGVAADLVMQVGRSVASPTPAVTLTATGSPVNDWVPLPNLRPGTVVQFIGGVVNQTLEVQFQWTERRPIA